MSNIAKIIKDEIQRITKKELNQITKLFNQSTAALEKTIKEQSKRIAALEIIAQPPLIPEKKITPVKSKPAQKKKSPGKPISKKPKQDGDKVTAQDIINLRKKLNLSQHKFAKLIKGSQSRISEWEKQKGVINITDAKVKRAILGLMRKQ